MSEGRPAGESPGDQPAAPPELPSGVAPGAGERVTEGGYVYSVVDDAGDARSAAARSTPRTPRESMRIGRGVLAALVILPALLVGATVWAITAFIMDDGDGGDSSPQNVASVINAFSQGQGSDTLRRYEGQLPPGLPEDLPAYAGARVVSSLVQIGGDDVVHLVVYDTEDRRADVAADLEAQFTDDPWQIDAGQDSRDGSLRQFSRIDDADITGIFLVTESKDSSVTTIFLSLQVISGADDVQLEDFEPVASRPLPPGYPDAVPLYPEATVIETAYNRAPDGDTFAVSSITRDSADDVLDFYREELEGDGYTVQDAEPATELAGASAITFESEDGAIAGNVTAGDFADDRNYTRIDLQLRSTE